MFTNTYLPHVGGVARSVSALVEDLRARGHRVVVVAPTFPGAGDLDEGPEEVFRVPAIQKYNGSDFSVTVVLPVRHQQAIERFGPDLVHSHHPFLLGDTALRVARHRHVPIVFTHHTRYERYTHYVTADSRTLSRFAIHLSTRYANLCQAVVAPSESLARLIIRRGVERPCRVVPTGVDLAFFRSGDRTRFRGRHGIPADAPVLGHVGRLAPEKNLEFLARAAALTVAERPDARCLVVGGGPSGTDIRRAFADQGQEDRLILTGPLSGRDLADAYAAMDLFVFASRTETQGMVLTEAMAAGLPVIALNAPGAREVVRDDVNGRLLPASASADDFAAAITRALAHAGHMEAWRAEAATTATRFGREACLDRMLEVYELARRELRRETGGEGTLTGWDELRAAVRTEWDLVAEKVGAAVRAAQSGRGFRTEPDEPRRRRGG